MQSGTGGGGSGSLETAHDNKIVLLLCAGLILLIFMDVQAGRHHRNLNKSAASSVQAGAGQIQESIRPLLRPVQKSAAEAFGAVVPNGSGRIRQQAQVPFAEDLSGRSSDDRTPLRGSAAGSSPASAVQVIKLYFLRFRGGRPRPVEVERRVAGPVSPERALQLLRQGPLSTERGLLSALDAVPLLGAKMRGDVLIVELGSAVATNGPRLVRARIEQIVLTASQFPGVRSVRFLINGELLDSVSGIEIAAPPPERVARYRGVPRQRR